MILTTWRTLMCITRQLLSDFSSSLAFTKLASPIQKSQTPFPLFSLCWYISLHHLPASWNHISLCEVRCIHMYLELCFLLVNLSFTSLICWPQWLNLGRSKEKRFFSPSALKLLHSFRKVSGDQDCWMIDSVKKVLFVGLFLCISDDIIFFSGYFPKLFAIISLRLYGQITLYFVPFESVHALTLITLLRWKQYNF